MDVVQYRAAEECRFIISIEERLKSKLVKGANPGFRIDYNKHAWHKLSVLFFSCIFVNLSYLVDSTV